MFFGNRLVRTRMLGGVGAGGERPPATRLGASRFFLPKGLSLQNDNLYNQFAMLHGTSAL